MSLICCGIVLGGCASRSVSTGEGSESAPSVPPRVESQPAPQAESSAPRKAAGRAGGYYQDDGPGDSPPPDLEAVPDPEPRHEPLHRFANRPYAVFGKEYQPKQKPAPHTERGVASWYGRKFHGQRTASGEPYDMYAMTAAHPTLPIPSYVRVTNMNNGRSVVVRVNDRGPFHANRVIDLSYTAAYKLGFLQQGSAEVEVEAILPETSGRMLTERPAGERGVALADGDPIARIAQGSTYDPGARDGLASAGIWLQLGAFASRENADNFGEKLRARLTEIADKLVLHADTGTVRLRAGPFSTREEAKRIAARVAEAFGIQPLLVRR